MFYHKINWGGQQEGQNFYWGGATPLASPLNRPWPAERAAMLCVWVGVTVDFVWTDGSLAANLWLSHVPADCLDTGISFGSYARLEYPTTFAFDIFLPYCKTWWQRKNCAKYWKYNRIKEKSLKDRGPKLNFRRTNGVEVCRRKSGLRPVAAPTQQRSQVISRSEHPRARSAGCTFFLKKVDDLFYSSTSKHKDRQRHWDCEIVSRSR